MRLVHLLATAREADLRRLAEGHVQDAKTLHGPLLASALESTVRSFAHVTRILSRAHAPAFAVLLNLLEAAEFRLPLDQLIVHATADLQSWAAGIAAGEVLGREQEYRLYRRVLAEAYRSDLELDASETALLGVIRTELGMSTSEHYLMGFHPELQPIWRKGDFLTQTLATLREGGLVFQLEGELVLPEELVTFARHAIGVPMSRSALRRLLGHLNAATLAEALMQRGLRSSGSKEERGERLVANLVVPQAVLGLDSLSNLRDLARDVRCPVTGSKEELVERLVGHFHEGRDVAELPPAPPPPQQEPRLLDEKAFRRLFLLLSGRELMEILDTLPQLRQGGAKDVKVATLWACHLSENSLLDILTARRLDEVLDRRGLKSSGSKSEKIQRLIEHARLLQEEEPNEQQAASGEPARVPVPTESPAAPLAAPVDGGAQQKGSDR